MKRYLMSKYFHFAHSGCVENFWGVTTRMGKYGAAPTFLMSLM